MQRWVHIKQGPEALGPCWNELPPLPPLKVNLPPLPVGADFFNGDNDLRAVFGFAPTAPTKKERESEETGATVPAVWLGADGFCPRWLASHHRRPIWPRRRTWCASDPLGWPAIPPVTPGCFVRAAPLLFAGERARRSFRGASPPTAHTPRRHGSFRLQWRRGSFAPACADSFTGRTKGLTCHEARGCTLAAFYMGRRPEMPPPG